MNIKQDKTRNKRKEANCRKYVIINISKFYKGEIKIIKIYQH